jgi:hypothetical protein
MSQSPAAELGNEGCRLANQEIPQLMRHGTTRGLKVVAAERSLLAALEVAIGKITDACHPRHTHVELQVVRYAYLSRVAEPAFRPIRRPRFALAPLAEASTD